MNQEERHLNMNEGIVVDRPVLATVNSILSIIVGIIGLILLPVEQ